MRRLQVLVVASIVLLAGLILVGATARALPPCEVQANVAAKESAEPPLAAPLDPADERLFGRLQARIDRRIEEKVAGAMEEVADNKKSGFGSLLAGAIYKAIQAVLLYLVIALVKAFLLKYGLLIGLIWFVSVALVAWPIGAMAGRHAARSKG